MNPSTTFTAADGDGYELNMGRWSRRLAIPFLQFTGTADAERVLDVGCGTGALAEAVLARCSPLEVHAVDAAQVYVDYARHRTPDPRLVFAVGDACSLSYPDNYFDQVISLAADERSRIEAAVRNAYLDGEPDGPRSYAALAWAVKGKVPCAATGDA